MKAARNSALRDNGFNHEIWNKCVFIHETGGTAENINIYPPWAFARGFFVFTEGLRIFKTHASEITEREKIHIGQKEKK